MTWQTLMEDFNDFLLLERVYSERTIETYSSNIQKLKKYCDENNKCDSPLRITLCDLTDFINTIAHLSTNTQAQYVASIKTFFKFLIFSEWLEVSPAEFLHSPKKTQSLPTYLTLEELSRVIDETSNVIFPLRSKAIILTIYCCGLRVMELIGLHNDDILSEVGLIRVTGKGNKERIIPISVHAIHAIEQYKKFERAVPVGNNTERLFLTSTGQPMRHVYVWTLFQNLCRMANIEKDVSPHSLRHSFATHLKQNGASLFEIKNLLGHASIIDTQIYAHLELKNLREAISKHTSNQPDTDGK